MSLPHVVRWAMGGTDRRVGVLHVRSTDWRVG